MTPPHLAQIQENQRRAQQRRDAETPEPPADVMHRARTETLTPTDVRDYPEYLIGTTTGNAMTRAVRCDHGYRLTSSCPSCDAADDQ